MSPPSPPLLYSGLAKGTALAKTTQAILYSLTVFNANAAARYLQLFDRNTVLSGAEVPIYSCLVPAAGQVILGTDQFTNAGMKFDTGLCFALSTTRETYTAATAADHSVFIFYK